MNKPVKLDKPAIAELIAQYDDAALSGKAAAAEFKICYIDPCKNNPDKIEELRKQVISIMGDRYFKKERTINGKAYKVGSPEFDKVSAAYNAVKGVKLSAAQKKLRLAVQLYINNVWAFLVLGGEKKKPASKASTEASTEASTASKTETTGAVSSPDGAEKGAIVQGSGITAVELATAVFNWLAVHRDAAARQELVTELSTVLSDVSKWKPAQAVELRQVM